MGTSCEGECAEKSVMAKTLLLVICSALLVHFQPEDSVAMYEADERSRHPPGADIDSDMEAQPIQVTLCYVHATMAGE